MITILSFEKYSLFKIQMCPYPVESVSDNLNVHFIQISLRDTVNEIRSLKDNDTNIN